MPTVLSDKQKYISRSPDNLMIGPVSRRVMIDLIRDRKVTSRYTFSVDGGPFHPVTSDPEFRQHLSRYEELPPEAPSSPPLSISDQARTDLDSLDDDDEDDEVDFTLSLHDLKDTVLELARLRQKLDDDEGVLETLDTIEPMEEAPVAVGDDDVIAIGDEMETQVEEAYEEVEVLELEEISDGGPARQVAKVPTSGRARLKAELLSPENRYTIRNPDGLMLGPVRIATVKDLIEAGALERKSQIQKNNDRFVDAWAIPEIRFLIVRLSQKK